MYKEQETLSSPLLSLCASVRQKSKISHCRYLNTLYLASKMLAKRLICFLSVK